jgi:hypothetical protein
VKIKMSISLDHELGDAVREAAAEAGMTLHVYTSDPHDQGGSPGTIVVGR